MHAFEFGVLFAGARYEFQYLPAGHGDVKAGLGSSLLWTCINLCSEVTDFSRRPWAAAFSFSVENEMHEC